MAEMICAIQQGASIDVWAGSLDSFDATPLMPQNTLSLMGCGRASKVAALVSRSRACSPLHAKRPCAASIPQRTIAHFHLLDALLGSSNGPAP